jgi:TfoX N-terminal domain
MPYTPALADAMRKALQRRRHITEKKMFGGYCWMLRGHMLCGVEVDRYMFRVGPALESTALRRPGSSPMDITGKPVRGFVWVKGKHARGVQLKGWIDLAAQYVGKLPPKTARAH